MGLVALLILILLALFLYWYFFSRTAATAGTLAGGGGGSINQIVANWTTAPTSIQVGQNATFVLHVQNNNPLGAVQLTDIVGRHYTFTVGPQAHISIVSVSPAASGPPNSASTDGNGQITVVIKATSLPSPAEGALVGISPAATSVTVETVFEVTPPPP